jgi:hypothetical protein
MKRRTANEPSASDRRLHTRTAVVKLVQLQDQTRSQLAKLVDLGGGGLGVVIAEPPAVGTRVKVVLDLAEMGPLEAAAVTVRVDSVVGLQFANLAPEDHQRLYEFIVRHGKAS